MLPYKLKKSLEKFIVPGKIVGILLVILHVIFSGDTAFSPWNYIKYLFIITAASGLWILLNSLYCKIRKSPESHDLADEYERKAEVSLYDMYREVTRNPWQILLIPGEDGIFFLPLLYPGINPWTALLGAGLFALAHLGCKPLYACLGTFLMSYVLCLTILPYGILTFIAGHLTVDIVIFILLFYMKKKKADESPIF